MRRTVDEAIADAKEMYMDSEDFKEFVVIKKEMGTPKKPKLGFEAMTHDRAHRSYGDCEIVWTTAVVAATNYP